MYDAGPGLLPTGPIHIAYCDDCMFVARSFKLVVLHTSIIFWSQKKKNRKKHTGWPKVESSMEKIFQTFG
jgi:hypothetical protein